MSGDFALTAANAPAVAAICVRQGGSKCSRLIGAADALRAGAGVATWEAGRTRSLEHAIAEALEERREFRP